MKDTRYEEPFIEVILIDEDIIATSSTREPGLEEGEVGYNSLDGSF
ncbi:hypothetical protein [[Ruminococcus] torques]|nr:hypothetical protein [[Ruminococcus] torques]MDM8236995.1 hypothetical protein [[Ruminococcus] torques]